MNGQLDRHLAPLAHGRHSVWTPNAKGYVTPINPHDVIAVCARFGIKIHHNGRSKHRDFGIESPMTASWMDPEGNLVRGSASNSIPDGLKWFYANQDEDAHMFVTREEYNLSPLSYPMGQVFQLTDSYPAE